MKKLILSIATVLLLTSCTQESIEQQNVSMLQEIVIPEGNFEKIYSYSESFYEEYSQVKSEGKIEQFTKIQVDDSVLQFSEDLTAEPINTEIIKRTSNTIYISTYSGEEVSYFKLVFSNKTSKAEIYNTDSQLNQTLDYPIQILTIE